MRHSASSANRFAHPPLWVGNPPVFNGAGRQNSGGPFQYLGGHDAADEGRPYEFVSAKMLIVDFFNESECILTEQNDG